MPVQQGALGQPQPMQQQPMQQMGGMPPQMGGAPRPPQMGMPPQMGGMPPQMGGMPPQGGMPRPAQRVGPPPQQFGPPGGQPGARPPAMFAPGVQQPGGPPQAVPAPQAVVPAPASGAPLSLAATRLLGMAGGFGGSPLQPTPQSTMKKVTKKRYLVKWLSLSYTAATWENEEDVNDDQKIALYHRQNKITVHKQRALQANYQIVHPGVDKWTKYNETPAYYKAQRILRPYQLEGLNWLVFSWYNQRNTILADEMGLGKTVQSISLMAHLYHRENIHGPFLVVAPLSTIQHWKREVEAWTHLNAVVYHDYDGWKGREYCREYEWYYYNKANRRDARPYRVPGISKFDVLITTYEIVQQDWKELKPIHWALLVIDAL